MVRSEDLTQLSNPNFICPDITYFLSTDNVRTIVLISVFSVIGGLGLFILLGWIIKCCCCSGDDDDGNDGVMADEAGMNMLERKD